MVIELVMAAEAPLAAATKFIEADQLARGAIIGAMLISAAFLAGIAVLRSSAAALPALASKSAREKVFRSMRSI